MSHTVHSKKATRWLVGEPLRCTARRWSRAAIGLLLPEQCAFCGKDLEGNPREGNHFSGNHRDANNGDIPYGGNVRGDEPRGGISRSDTPRKGIPQRGPSPKEDSTGRDACKLTPVEAASPDHMGNCDDTGNCDQYSGELTSGVGLVSEGARRPEAQPIRSWTRRAKQANPGDSSMQPDEVAAPRIGKPKPDDLLGQSLALCGSCIPLLLEFQDARCRRCGATIGTANARSLPTQGDSTREPACRRCQGRRFPFRRVLGLGRYEGALREAILRMKRSGGDPLTTAVTQLLWKCHGREIGRWRPDVVVGVPLNWGKRIRRGTCTTEQIGRCLAKRLGVSYLGGALRCRRKLFVQAGLSPDSRRRNVRGAFAVGTGYDFSGAHLLLVDDVMTTGATVREVSRTLRRAGAEDISVAVLACSGDGGTGRLAI